MIRVTKVKATKTILTSAKHKESNMSKTGQTISCPKCNEKIDVTDLLFSEVTKESEERHKSEMDAVKQKAEAEFEHRKAEYIKNYTANTDIKLAEEKKRIKDKLENATAAAMKILKKDLDDQTKTIQELSGAAAELENLKRKNELTIAQAKSETEARVYKQVSAETKDLIDQSNRDHQLKIDEITNNAALKNAELQKKLDESKASAEELLRKQNQGSQQSQGEVQEIAIENWLSSYFPYDDIQEIKKGESGADTFHVVKNQAQIVCGTILYESKRTKSFSASWIPKFKKDIQNKNADIGILISDAMPPDIPSFGEKDGVFICSYTHFKALVPVIRDNIIKQKLISTSQENKGGKMEMLYDFITGNEYRLHVQAIIDSFTQMESELNQEKRSMNKIWAKREKHIEGIIMNTARMSGAIEGIAGNVLPTIPGLELYDEEESETNVLEHDQNIQDHKDLPF